MVLGTRAERGHGPAPSSLSWLGVGPGRRRARKGRSREFPFSFCFSSYSYLDWTGEGGFLFLLFRTDGLRYPYFPISSAPRIFRHLRHRHWVLLLRMPFLGCPQLARPDFRIVLCDLPSALPHKFPFPFFRFHRDLKVQLRNTEVRVIISLFTGLFPPHLAPSSSLTSYSHFTHHPPTPSYLASSVT